MLDFSQVSLWQSKSCMYALLVCITDVDECETNNGGCDQVCTNTDGSFFCSCDEGYVLTPDGFNCSGSLELNTHRDCLHQQCLCADINECLRNNGGCDQTCTNTEGSFQCSCDVGHFLAADNRDCEGGGNMAHVSGIGLFYFDRHQRMHD